LEIRFLKRNLLQRLFGISVTKPPGDQGCWSYAERKVILDLDRVPELRQRGGAVRLEGKNLPERVLVIHGDDGEFHVFRNRCKHMGRRLDPVPGTRSVQCCSVGKSTYDYGGTVQYGPAKESVETLPVNRDGTKLEITF
jgi:nitrite reductase/ring-hydroxylating ferredoxin subunit